MRCLTCHVFDTVVVIIIDIFNFKLHFHTSSPSPFSRRAVVNYWQRYVHEVLVNHLGGLSLPRKSVVRLTDRPDMTLDVYRGRKTTKQQQHTSCCSPSSTVGKLHLHVSDLGSAVG